MTTEPFPIVLRHGNEDDNEPPYQSIAHIGKRIFEGTPWYWPEPTITNESWP